MPRVFPIMRLGIDTPGSLGVIDTELSGGVVDMVVLDYSTYAQMGGDAYGGSDFPTGWQTSVQAKLAKTLATLSANKIAFLVVNMPGASDFPDELAYFRIPKGTPDDHADTGPQNQPTNVQYYHDEIANVLAHSGVPTVDLWPAFLEAYDSPNRMPLYNTWDHHLSRFGRSVVADAVATKILGMKPWAK
jgi:hypothetical protein